MTDSCVSPPLQFHPKMDPWRLTNPNCFTDTNKQVVYESCSSDENDDQVSNNENLDTNKRIKTDDVEKDSKPKTPSSEEVVKNQSQKTKQSSIMSFFKKPQKTWSLLY